jgi:hypothetical protein
MQRRIWLGALVWMSKGCKRSAKLACAVVLFVSVLLTTGNAQTLRGSAVWSVNGHRYEVWESYGIPWSHAKDFASRQYRQGYGYGYLATITSAAENNFVANLAFSSMGWWVELWLGGFQPPDECRRDANWMWITGEPWGYTNWAPGEPNDHQGPCSEQHLGIHRDGLWNDEGYLGNIRGFIIEYGHPARVPYVDLNANPVSLPADNRSVSTLTLTYRYSDGTPIVGRTIRFISSRGSADTFSSNTAVTNAQGQASVTVRSGTAGVATFTCRDETAGVDLPASVQVTFTPVSQRRPVIDSVRTSLGVQGPFLEDVSLDNTITVRVANWGDGAPGRVEFRLPNGTVRTVTPTNNEASLTLDMGRDLGYAPNGQWNTVRIVAYNAEGVASEVREVHLLGLSLPPSLWRDHWLREPVVSILVSGGEIRAAEIRIKFVLKWPSTEVDAVRRVPYMGHTYWGHQSNYFIAELELIFQAARYGESTTISGRAEFRAGREVTRRYTHYGRYPTHFVHFLSVNQEVSGGIRGQIQFAPRLRLEELAFFLAGTARSETTDILPVLINICCAHLSPCCALHPITHFVDLFGRFVITGEGAIVFYDDGQFGFRDSELTLNIGAALVLSVDRRWQRFVYGEVLGGGNLFVRLQFPGSSCNAGFFGVPFLNQVGAEFSVQGQVYIPFVRIEADFNLFNRRWVYPRARCGFLGSPCWLQSPIGEWRSPLRLYLYREPYHQLVAGSQFFPQDDNWDVREEQLIQNVFPTAEPALTWKDGRAVIVYVYDDPNLPAHQSTEIRALMQQPDGSWRDVPITQDTALDSQPHMATDASGNLIAVWTRLEDVDPTPTPTCVFPKARLRMRSTTLKQALGARLCCSRKTTGWMLCRSWCAGRMGNSTWCG